MIDKEPDQVLDPGAVTALFASVRDHMDGKGLFWVTTRMDIMEQLDQILVLDQGKVAEQGSYDELSNREGAFKRLFIADQLA